MDTQLNSAVNNRQFQMPSAYTRQSEIEPGEGKKPEANSQISERGRLISESGSISSQFVQSNETSIEITTREGDRVKVSYSAFTQLSSNQSYSFSQQGRSASYDYSATSSTRFQFSVQGDLNKDEQQAINNLLNDMGDIASQFFNGDVQSAFNAAMELGFDSKELKGFSLDFQKSSYIEIAQTYQRTEQIMSPSQPEADPGPAIDLLSQLQQFIEQSKENTVIKEPENTIKSLLADMLNSLSSEMSKPVFNYIKDAIE